MRIAIQKWCLLFGFVCVFAIAGIVAVNYLLNRDGYFSKSDYGQANDFNAHLVTRNAKISYIKKNPDLFTGFIIGGSRAMILDPEIISRYTGLAFYNMGFSLGFQEDYERTINFLIENTQAKHIILQLHGEEETFLKNSPERWAELKNLYVFDSRPMSKLMELKTVLLRNIATSSVISYLINIIFGKSPAVFRFNENGYVSNSQMDDPDYFRTVDEKIIPVFKSTYRNIFRDKNSLYMSPDTKLIYDSLKRIKMNCMLKGITLTIVLAPSSPFVLSRNESPDYWEYLRNIAMISSFYNFNGYSSYNFNPYNFIDDNHYRKEMADKMLRIIFGKEEAEDDWGIYLSPENIEAYLERRKAAYYRLKKEYEETGNIPLGHVNGPGFIPF